MNEEIVAPFPATLRTAPIAKQCRSTVLISSARALEDSGHLDAYLRCGGAEVFPTIKSTVVGQWLPIDVAFAHYAACDKIGLSREQQSDLGAELIDRLRQTFLARVVAALPNDPASQWGVLTRLAHLHSRSFDGGGVQVVKLGPKDARLDVVGFPLARIGYVRQGYRGMVRAAGRFFARKVFVTDVTDAASANALAFRLAWV